MTKRHFEAFAERIREAQRMGISRDEARFAAHVVIDIACRFNPRFDRERFLKACRLEQHS